MEFFNKIFDKLTVTKYYGQYNLFEKIVAIAAIIFGLVWEYMILKSKGIL